MMNQAQFQQIFERILDKSETVLIEKAKEYARDDDRLRNFRMGAGLTERTPEQVVWGFAVKHIVSITDMVESEESYPGELWDEKVGDAINYLILLRAQVTETDMSRGRNQSE